jgi:formylmethanofuran dehydrogenase subunit E
MKPELHSLLEQTAALHNHLCPRQVLGVRMGIYAAELLDLPYPQQNKRLYTFVETDGCFADGVAVATGCRLGHRTMRLMDYGKVAASFIDTLMDVAVRIRPRLNVRERACYYSSVDRSRWHLQLDAYQKMPLDELFDVVEIRLQLSMKDIISRAGVRVNCSQCGEEIINERETLVDNQIYCRSCAGQSYYHQLVTPENASL